MTTPAKLKFTIYQGATFREHLDRQTIPYEVVADTCGNLTKVCDGTAVPQTDITDENYTGCEARMQLREDVDSATALLDCTTANGRLALSGKRLTIHFTDAETAAMGFDSCIGHVEVIRPTGDVERQYEIAFALNKEGTR